MFNAEKETKNIIKFIKKYMNGEELPKEVSEKIERLHKNAYHKFNLPYYKREICE